MRTNTLLRQQGSMLLQVIASVFILSAGLTGALSLIVGAMQANRIHSERLLATHLSAEGIEAIQNLRDTNWLLYSNSQSACWNFWADTDHNGIIDEGDASCTENASSQNDYPWAPARGNLRTPPESTDDTIPQKFIVDLDLTTMRWNLVSEEDLENWSPGARDYTGKKFQLYKKTYANGVSFYTHDKKVAANETVEESFFSRSIIMHYLDATDAQDDNGILKNGYFPVGDSDQDNRILVVSTVSWRSGGQAHQVTLSKLITDYSQPE